MFTLLAEQQKKNLYKQYRLRLLIVSMLLLCVVLLISIGLLLPSHIILTIEKRALLEEKRGQDTMIKTEGSKDLQNTLAGIKDMLDMVAPDRSAVFESLKVMMSNRPPGVTFSSISYERGVNGPSSMTVGGNAITRTALLEFSKSLEKQKIWSDISLPIANLAKESKLTFSLTALGKF